MSGKLVVGDHARTTNLMPALDKLEVEITEISYDDDGIPLYTVRLLQVHTDTAWHLDDHIDLHRYELETMR